MWTGSLNRFIFGGKYVNKTKHSKRIISVITEMLLLHSSSNESIFLNAIYSPINTATKKLPISKKAKFFPMIPVYV